MGIFLRRRVSGRGCSWVGDYPAFPVTGNFQNGRTVQEKYPRPDGKSRPACLYEYRSGRAILFGYHFLKDFLPHGEGGRFGGSGFILFLNLAIGLKVGAAMSIIFYSLAGEKRG